MACQHARLVLLIGSLAFLFGASEALFNCFTPNMFKMGGKLGQQGAYGAHQGERAHWYPQQQQQQQQHYLTAMGYGQHPMSRLFQPKWRSSLFGSKRWMDWRTNGQAGNMNFYRPGLGYWPGAAHVPPPPSSAIQPQTNQFSELLNLSPYTSNSITQQLPTGANSGSTSLYGSSQSQQQPLSNSNNLNDGWSVPYVSPYNRPAFQQYGDTYSILPGGGVPVGPPAKQQLDPGSYGTKGASGNKQQPSSLQQQQQQQQQYGTTKNVLVADGGYSSLDAHLMERHPYKTRGQLSSSDFGYSYPDWYSGVVDSPAKIAQQLYRQQQRRVLMGVKY